MLYRNIFHITYLEHISNTNPIQNAYCPRQICISNSTINRTNFDAEPLTFQQTRAGVDSRGHSHPPSRSPQFEKPQGLRNAGGVVWEELERFPGFSRPPTAAKLAAIAQNASRVQQLQKTISYDAEATGEWF